MWLVALAGVAAADIVVPGRDEAPPCDTSRCGDAEARECLTSLGQVPDCGWVTDEWERACLRKSGTRAVHVMCRSAAAAPAPADPSPAAPEARGCGCASPVAPPPAVGLLPLLAGLALRRWGRDSRAGRSAGSGYRLRTTGLQETALEASSLKPEA